MTTTDATDPTAPIYREVQYDPPVAPETVAAWQDQLDRAVPRYPGYVSHLRLVWEAGDPWDPVERWYLYDCTPRRIFEESATKRRIMGVPEYDNADAILIRDLDGPSPREDGYYDRVLQQFIHTRERECTLTQWRLWQQHGVYGIPWWVIQGVKGGHKRWFATDEKKALRYAKLPDEPPVPGSLPYAPFDQRVLDRVLTYDRLRRFTQKLSRTGVKAEHKDLVRKARKAYLDHLGDVVAEARDMLRNADLPTLPGGPAPARAMDWEAEIDRFLTQGE